LKRGELGHETAVVGDGKERDERRIGRPDELHVVLAVIERLSSTINSGAALRQKTAQKDSSLVLKIEQKGWGCATRLGSRRGALAAPTRCPQKQKATRSSAVAVISACALQLFVGFTVISEA
jgi:hypothetical protein